MYLVQYSTQITKGKLFIVVCAMSEDECEAKVHELVQGSFGEKVVITNLFKCF